MKQIKVNPDNEMYYSDDFIKGFNEGAKRQFEADLADRKTDIAEAYLRGWNNALDAVKNGKFVLKTEQTSNSSEKPNNCTDCECTDDCTTCKEAEHGCKDEPQTETEIARAIVHKIIDNAVIAEDAYPDLRQKMHDAVDEYEPQYEMGMGTIKCDNCSEYGSFKCTKCDGEMYFKRLEPKDEPQTEKADRIPFDPLVEMDIKRAVEERLRQTERSE